MLHTLFRRLRMWLRRGKIEGELEREFRFHLEMEAAENMRRGMSEDEARQAARRSFGGVEPVKEAYRDLSRFRFVEELWQDAWYGLRMLRKHPGFTTVAVLTLALGIGANVAVFSVVNATLLKSLPYPEADRLVTLQNQFLARNLKNAGVSAADYADYRRLKRVFEEVAAGQGSGFNFTGAERAENIPGAFVTAGIFPLLGVKPIVGRVFNEDEDRPGYNQVVALSEGFWKRRFGADPNVVGRALRLNDQSYTVVGVIPPAPEVLGANDVFIPAAFTSEHRTRKTQSTDRGIERRALFPLFAKPRLHDHARRARR
jgi:putative ABC transport system permease protein